MDKFDISLDTSEILQIQLAITDDVVPPVNDRNNRLSQNKRSSSSQNLTIKYFPDDYADNTNGDSSKPAKVPYNWQSSKTCIKERIEFMFNNETLADVHFVVGKDAKKQKIPAHKFVLSVGSKVFDAMFNGNLAMKSDEIEIPDVEPAAFFALLRFLYSDCVRIGPETVMTTLYTAKKYAVPALEKHCVEFLQHNLSPDNAFMLLTQARLFDEPQLASLCLKTIDRHTGDAITAEDFIDVDLDTLCCVLERDTLRIKEVKLFHAVLRWAEAECKRQNLPVTADNQRTVLDRALKLIRFPLMAIEDFASTAAQSGILTDKEIVSIFLYFTVNPKPSITFLDTPRSTMTGNELFVNRFQQTEMRWGYSGTCDRIRFTVDQPIYVIGYGLYGSVYQPADYKVSIQLIQASSGKVLGRNDTSYSGDGTPNIFKVLFSEPIQIARNTSYIASAAIQGPDSYYGAKGLRKALADSPNGKITFQFIYSNGNNNGSSVEDGQIPQILFYT
ncbi:BTB/POZ domain-containing protein 2-like [Planococcus citri]|uniref:BTB/POZ domain-containing protein 2-like n=1 Tax=Planococcus citri TaxID=170843 RepID=UPI0031F72D07